jgi:hypothetical protein
LFKKGVGMNKLLKMGIIKTQPQKWTKENEDEILVMSSARLSSSKIAERVGRSQISVAIKLKRLTKSNDTYNSEHRKDKYLKNEEFLKMINPKSVLDLYAGNSWYKDKVFLLKTNDTDLKFDTNHHEKALNLLYKLSIENKKFDLIDLDPYGSAIEEFPLALKLANKGIIITLGELGHKRWKRLDFVKKWYGISSLEYFTTDVMVNVLKNIGLRYGKQITPVIVGEYNLISRVYFTIKKVKTLEQWGLE